jgi:Scavenger receptor cysteine-rich domain
MATGTPGRGAIEVFNGAAWQMAHCPPFWSDWSPSTNTASVVCRQLGLNPMGATLRSAPILPPPQMDHGYALGVLNIHCNGTEASLAECSINWSTWTSKQPAQLFCSTWATTADPPYHGDMRLAGGPTELSGRVEYFSEGQWRSVVTPQSSVVAEVFAQNFCVNVFNRMFEWVEATSRFGVAPNGTWNTLVSCQSWNGVYDYQACLLTTEWWENPVSTVPQPLGMSCNGSYITTDDDDYEGSGGISIGLSDFAGLFVGFALGIACVLACGVYGAHRLWTASRSRAPVPSLNVAHVQEYQLAPADTEP